MIEKSLKNTPIFNLSFPSKKILFMETKDEVLFNTEDEIKVDYTKSTPKIYEQLLSICNNEYYTNKKKKITFINPDVQATEFTYDFHIDKLSSDKFEVYKVNSLVKDIDWYAAYYAKYHSDIKDIYKKKAVSEENEKIRDEWISRQPLAKEMKEILDKVRYDPTAPEIESFKDIVDQHGYLHGYYLKAV